MIRLPLLLILFVFVFGANAQKILSGHVMIAGSNSPVPSANVYLSTTSVGTTTDERGNFTIQRFPEGRYELIVSSLGYETYHLVMRSDQLPLKLEIFLTPKAEELQEVILEPYDKDGWEKWGKYFIENFIGTSAFADECKLMNKEVLRLRLNKKTNILRVNASDQLIIENHALGYILTYNLTKFEFNMDTKEFVYQGYPFFEEMSAPRKGLQKRWNANRQIAYNGSLIHFMRSVYQDEIKEQKFKVRQWLNLPDAERNRVKAIYPYQSKKVVDRKVSVVQENGRSIVVDEKDTGKIIHPDSLAYYQSVMRQINQKNIFIDVPLSKKDIAYSIDNLTVGLQFEHIEVVYTPKRNPDEYQKYIPKIQAYNAVTSILHKVTVQPVSVLANGSFFDGINLSVSGYWSWWEKMCNKLPYDYHEQEKK